MIASSLVLASCNAVTATAISAISMAGVTVCGTGTVDLSSPKFRRLISMIAPSLRSPGGSA